MTLKCKMNVQSFGYIDTKKDASILEKDKEYTLEKAHDEVSKSDYYKVFYNDTLITTLSESEFKLFFKD